MPPKGKKKKITQVESADSPAVQETFATKKPRFRPNLTEDEEDLMLEFLRENQFLYDKKKKLYHNKHLREKAWNEQAARMDRDKADLEVWYDSLRTRYGKLLKGSSKSGSGASSLSDRDRWISSQMSFLKPFIADRRTAKPMVSFKQKTCSPSDIPPGEEEPSTSKESVTPPCDVNSEAGSSVCSKKRENLEDKLRQTEADQNQLLLLTKEFVQRYQGDPVRRSECDYFASVIYTLPHDVYRKVSREIHATLRAAIDETDRRNGQQHNVHPQNVQQQVPQHHVTHEYQPQYQQYTTPQPFQSSEQYVRSQWQPPPNQWPAQPVDATNVWKSQDANWVNKQPLQSQSSRPAPSTTWTPGMSTPVSQDAPAPAPMNLSTVNLNVSSFIRHLDDNEPEEDEDTD